MYQTALLLHVIGATIWTGGHLVLACVILPQVLKQRDLAFIQRFENAYEKIGIPALLVQIITGFYLVGYWLPDESVPGAPTHPASWLLVTKVSLLLATAALAADARLRIIPRLTPERLPSLAWHIIPVTVISVLFVIAGVGYRFGWFVW
jgi:putative copper export protein